MSGDFPTIEQVLQKACDSAGFDDFGPEEFRGALDALLASLRDGSNLTPAAIAAELDEVHGLLLNRLRMGEMFRRFPEIAQERIDRPIIIIGPQRSGTSKLFRVIAADPQWNHLVTWQAIDFIPSGMERPSAFADGTRIAGSERWVASMRDRQSGHSFETHAPEMEALLMRDSFMLNSGKRLLPGHQAYAAAADHAPVYRRLRRQLQLIQWQNRTAGKRWVLKCPPHLLALDALLDEFPDATLVMTHRHPAQSIASMCRLAELAQTGTALSVDKPLIGELWGRRIIMLELARFLDFEDRGRADGVVHVAYRTIERDAIAAIEAIYAAAGAPVTDETRERVAAWEAANPRHKDGGFSYRLEDYGFTKAGIEQECAAWMKRYGHMLDESAPG